MANSSHTGNDVFDVRRVRRLVELMQENDLTELDIQQGDMRIQLKRNSAVSSFIQVPAASPVAFPVPPASPLPQSSVAPANPTSTNSTPEENVHVIKSPMVGTFYIASNPESPPFVKVGDSVNPETTVCLIEAMKVYNEIQAECTGKIVAVLVKNGDTVEFGMPLFKVSTQ